LKIEGSGFHFYTFYVLIFKVLITLKLKTISFEWLINAKFRFYDPEPLLWQLQPVMAIWMDFSLIFFMKISTFLWPFVLFVWFFQGKWVHK